MAVGLRLAASTVPGSSNLFDLTVNDGDGDSDDSDCVCAQSFKLSHRSHSPSQSQSAASFSPSTQIQYHTRLYQVEKIYPLGIYIYIISKSNRMTATASLPLLHLPQVVLVYLNLPI